MIENRLKIGLIGTINDLKNHIKAIKKVKEFEISAFYTEETGYPEKILSVPAFSKVEALLLQSDCILFCSPDTHDYPHIVQAIKEFKHVFINGHLYHLGYEPIALSELIKEAGICFAVGQSHITHPLIEGAEPMLNQPLLIEIDHFLPKSRKKHSVFQDLLLNDLDFISQYISSTVKRINANSLTLNNCHPDLLHTRIEYNNGAVCTIKSGFLYSEAIYTIKIYQRGNVIKLDFSKPYIKCTNPKEHEDQQEIINIGVVSDPETGAEESLIKNLYRFIKAIKTDAKFPNDFENAYKSFSIAKKIEEKIKLNHN